MDFIFMLTRNDATVENALDLVEVARAVGVRHIGFRDVGVDAATLARLAAAIRAAGARLHMEVVATTRETELQSVRAALALGVDVLLGGVHVEDALALIGGAPVAYLPFAGRPEGHPTRLGGGPERIEADCRAFFAKGCAGVDLLAYRAIEADPIALIRAARRGLGREGRLVVAGSVDSAERISAVRAAGADAFTIGTAAIDGLYARDRAGLAAQLAAVLADCRAAL
jgi:hypothetical protein